MSLINIILENSLLNILVRFLVNVAVIFVIIRIIYYRYTRKNEYLFSYFLMGITIFFICSILDTVNIQLGMALGLFAVFAILRFRTVNYSVKDMTYMFIVIGISIINSLANIPPPYVSALIINLIIIIAVYSLELFYQKNYLNHIIVVYNKLELLSPQHNDKLLKDLSANTGYDVKKVKIRRININKRSSEIEIFYRENDREYIE